MSPDRAATLKGRAAEAALALVEDGMRLGLGSGSTAEIFVDLLGERVAAGLAIVAVPTSERTATRARARSIRLVTLDDEPALDLTVDGADEIGPGLALIKGGGGALLREKIVAAASARMAVIADASKRVAVLGAFPLPIEVVPFGLEATRRAIAAAAAGLGLSGTISTRSSSDGQVFRTDGGHLILDASFRRIPDPEALARALAAIPGVVEHGLFLRLASVAFVAGPEGVETIRP